MQAFNASQLNTMPTPTYQFDDLPSARAMLPWQGNDGTVYGTPAFAGKCWNRSVGWFPASCDGSVETACLEVRAAAAAAAARTGGARVDAGIRPGRAHSQFCNELSSS